MHGEQTLARDTRAFIVLVALLQGGLLYLARQGQALGWWPFDALPGRICWYTLVLGVPTAMTLSVLHLRDRRFWLQTLLLVVVFVPLAAWAGWNAGGAQAVDASPMLGPFGLSMSLGLFVALPWLQCRLSSGRWRADYPPLFEHAWQNALTLALALLFTGICWAVLVLWGQLFALVQITFFRELFREEAFIHLATGAMAGLGILIGRTQQRPVQIARQVLFAIFKGLLPLLAFIAVLFVASLPFTGLAPLWQTRSAATLLVGVIALLVLFANAVYQDGEGQPPYPLWLRRLVEAGLLVLPVYALLALYAMSLRIGQYGWTSDRVWALLVTVMAALYAGGYAIAVLRRGRTWLPLLGRINMHLSWVLITLVVLVDSPLLDPHRIGVASTVARISAAAPELDEADLRYLRFDAGRRGYEALQQLRDAPGFADADAARQRIERFIARTSRWGGEDQPAGQSQQIDDVATLRRQIVPIGGSADADPSWWEAVADDTVPAERCRDAGADCLFLRRDFDNDGRDEVLLCDAVNEYMLSCMLHSFGDGRWQQAGGISLWAGDADREAFRAGQIELLMPRWAQIRVGKGAPQRIEPSTVADGYQPLPAPSHHTE